MRLFPGLLVVFFAIDAAFAASRLQRAEPDASGVALFESPGDLDQLDCRVDTRKPDMAIDLRFHTGFSVSLPVKKLVGGPGEIRILMRVTPAAAPDRRVVFSMTTPTPAIGEDAEGDVELAGDFAVGPGRYDVDWALSFGGSACRKQWQVEAKLERPFSQVPLAIGADTAEELPPDPFAETGQTTERQPHSLHVKVLVNFAPAGVNNTVMGADDVRVIASILHAVAREPRFGRFSLVAFSSDQERILERQTAAAKIDFHALGRAVRQLRTGVVSMRQMEDEQSGTKFLDRLLRAELSEQDRPADAIVVISPKLSLDTKIPDRDLSDRKAPPVFLLSYNPQPIRDPWQGILARAVKNTYRGLAYTITGPKDLGMALVRMNERIPARD